MSKNKIVSLLIDLVLVIVAILGCLYIYNAIKQEITKYSTDEYNNTPYISDSVDSSAAESNAVEEMIIEEPTSSSAKEILLELNPIIEYNTQLACDTDGADESYGSANWQKTTSYLYQGIARYWGKSLDASEINYIVYNSSEYYGYVGLVIDVKDGSYVFVICGDANWNSHWHELSLHALRELGYTGRNGKIRAWGNNAPRGNFITVILNESKLQLGSPKNANNKIEERVRDILTGIDIDELVSELIIEYKY